MTTRTCRAPGCGARTSRYGRFCSTHRSRDRRHGHPEQVAITKTDLAPYVRRVRARITKNEDNPLWAECEARWLSVVEHARRILAAFARKEAGYRFDRIAAHEAVKLADNVSPQQVLETTFAMYLLADRHPRRFRSDASFQTQLVRRLRGLTDLNAGQWFNHRTGKTHRAYREMTPRAVTSFAEWITASLGPVGLHLARLERSDEEARQRGVNAFAQAVEALR